MTNLKNEPRELNIDELNAVSGGTFTIDMGWCAATVGIDSGNLIVAGSAGNHQGAAWVKLPSKK